MKISKAGLDLIKKLEGFRNHPYYDGGGVATIGYGFTYYPWNGKAVTIQDSPITKAEADEMLEELVRPYAESVDKYVTATLTQNQFDALVSFTYNVGVGAFKDSTLLKRINKNPKDPDIEYQFKRWRYDNGQEVKGLLKRRNQEYYLYNL